MQRLSGFPARPAQEGKRLDQPVVPAVGRTPAAPPEGLEHVCLVRTDHHPALARLEHPQRLRDRPGLHGRTAGSGRHAAAGIPDHRALLVHGPPDDPNAPAADARLWQEAAVAVRLDDVELGKHLQLRVLLHGAVSVRPPGRGVRRKVKSLPRRRGASLMTPQRPRTIPAVAGQKCSTR